MSVHGRAWHERRRLSAGASDLPVVLGCSPYANASQLRLAWSKRGLLRIPDEPTNDRVTAEVLEQAARSYLSRALQCDVDYIPDRDDFATVCATCGQSCKVFDGGSPCCDLCPAVGHMHANMDGRIVYKGRAVNFEGKSISYHNPNYDGWRRKQVPDHVQWQTQQQMLCGRLPATVILLFDAPNMRFDVRVVEADKERHEFIARVWRTWWRQAVIEKVDPATRWTAVEDIIKERWPGAEPGKVVDFDDRLENVALEWVAAARMATTSKKEAAEARAELLRFMEDATMANLPSGGYLSRTVARNGAVRLTYHEEIRA